MFASALKSKANSLLTSAATKALTVPRLVRPLATVVPNTTTTTRLSAPVPPAPAAAPKIGTLSANTPLAAAFAPAPPVIRATPMPETAVPAALHLQNGVTFHGECYGAPRALGGEVVFTTGMVGYPESLTDPSYAGQILVLTQPLAGNYGVPEPTYDEHGLPTRFESDRIHARAVVVQAYTWQHSHREAAMSLGAWCKAQGVPLISGVDTRALVQHLRDGGAKLGHVAVNGQAPLAYEDPNATNLVAEVSVRAPVVYNRGAAKKVAVMDFGLKYNILRHLLMQGFEVTVLPYDFPVHTVVDQYDGVFLSNGPGDPMQLGAAVASLRQVLKSQSALPDHTKTPIFGICMGNHVLGLAAGLQTYKLQFGNRGHNQPCLDLTSKVPKCVITSQNHGYALDDRVMPQGWAAYFRNANDGSNEGILGGGGVWRSVQFHPEARGGPVDTMYLFDEFAAQVSAFHNVRKQMAVSQSQQKVVEAVPETVVDPFVAYMAARNAGAVSSARAMQ
ncbi:hypothetical protein GGF32_008481 [Allomyces javanicus]|nr:hypothetical protein GGF32_008481 [Allomyces javanicus]